MFVCKHEGQYYETDRMGITHHSNHVQWMDLWKIEEEGIISPVISISCEYKAITTFADQVSIEISVKSVKLSKLSFLYRMVNQDCILVCTTVSEHSFLSKEASFVNLKNDFPVFFALSKEQLTLE